MQLLNMQVLNDVICSMSGMPAGKIQIKIFNYIKTIVEVSNHITTTLEKKFLTISQHHSNKNLQLNDNTAPKQVCKKKKK